MLKGEYTSFQYMVVYIAVMQVSPLPNTSLPCTPLSYVRGLSEQGDG
jgi:hypothetical protein